MKANTYSPITPKCTHTHYKVTHNIYRLTSQPEDTVAVRPMTKDKIRIQTFNKWQLEIENERLARNLVKLRCNWGDKEGVWDLWTDWEVLALAEFAQHWLCFPLLRRMGTQALCCPRANVHYIWQCQYGTFLSPQKVLWDSTALDIA